MLGKGGYFRRYSVCLQAWWYVQVRRFTAKSRLFTRFVQRAFLLALDNMDNYYVAPDAFLRMLKYYRGNFRLWLFTYRHSRPLRYRNKRSHCKRWQLFGKSFKWCKSRTHKITWWIIFLINSLEKIMFKNFRKENNNNTKNM